MPLACVFELGGISMKVLSKKACHSEVLAIGLQGVKVYRHVLSLLLLQPCQVIITSDANLVQVLYMLEDGVLDISVDLNIKRLDMANSDMH